MLKTIVIIDLEPLTIQREKIFCIPELMNYGFNLQFWDFSYSIHHGNKFADTIERPYAIKINDLSELEKRLQKVPIPKCLFVVNRDGNNAAFLHLLKKYSCFIIGISLFDTTSIPQLPFWVKYTHITLRGAVTYIWDKLKSYLQKANPEISTPFDVIVASKSSPEVNFYINHPDYVTYKQIKDLEPIIDEPYAVFIDQFFPIHPDLLGYKQCVSAEDYQRRLNRFFGDIEQKYNLKVVIAAHPKADYDVNTFEGRKIIKYSTSQLVKDAHFVIMHSSNSLAYVLLFNKPVVLLTTNLFRNYFRLRLQVLRVARMCNLPITNMDKYNISKVVIKPVDSKIAQQYIDTFLTRPSIKDKTNIQILIEIFNELSKNNG